jgi:hypothetical protein
MEPGARSAATAVAGVVGVLALVTLAASQGSDPVLRGRPGRPNRGYDTPSPTPSPGPSGTAGDPGALESVLKVLLQILVVGLEIAAAVLLLALLFWGARSLLRRWRIRLASRAPRPEHVDFPVLDVADTLTAELVSGAAAHRALLEQGSPRNGIVACWSEFEQAAARVGHAREPWQTSSEFTLEMFDLVGADGGAVSRLAGHYREARFSVHEITEADRAEARRDLDTIMAGLGQRRRAGAS